VSLHGIAINCDNDLSPFGLIVPCGVRTHGVTSLTQESGRTVSVADAKPTTACAFESVFGLRLEHVEAPEVLA
jgi:lipoyl(octanoyl) transferase